GGTDAAAFTINAATGVVKIVGAADYETQSSYSIDVIATDGGGLSDTRAVAITVTNVNDNPVVLSDADGNTNAVAEHAANGTTVGVTALGVDGDAGTTVTYELTDDAGGRFAIDANSGVVTLADTTLIDRSAAASHDITVKATSSDGSVQTAL